METKCGREKQASNLADRLLNAKRASTIENNLYVKNRGNSTSRKKAIDAMCAHCMGCTADHMEPNYKNDIRDCTAHECPLYAFRPYKGES